MLRKISSEGAPAPFFIDKKRCKTRDFNSPITAIFLLKIRASSRRQPNPWDKLPARSSPHESAVAPSFRKSPSTTLDNSNTNNQ